MSYAYDIDPDARTAVLAFEYDTSIAEGIEACERLYADPRWRPGFHRIVDLRRVSDMGARPDDVAALVEHDVAVADVVGEGLDVLLVSRTSAAVLAQQYATRAQAGPRIVHVTSSREEARRLIADHGRA